MPISPEQYARTGAYELLSAAARGHLAFDRRLIDALTADPGRTLPDLVRFSREDHGEDRFDLAFDVAYLFMLMPTPEAVPFLVGELRREPEDAAPELIDLANRLGEPAANAILGLFDETGRTNSEFLFVAMMAGARGPRVDEAVAAIAATDADDGAFLREIAETAPERDPAEPSLEYPAEADPDLTDLPENEREEFLLSTPARFRLLAVASFLGEELTDRRRQQLMDLGAHDPDARVRGHAWEVLRDDTDQPAILEAMTARFALATDPHERACIANALSYHLEVAGVVEAIEAAYAEPAHRPKALEAMWRSLDRRWVDRPARHLEDADVEVRRHAVLAVGYFQLRNEAKRIEPLFRNADVREDAIYAYGLAAPADETAFGLRQLEKRIESLAGGLTEEEESALADAFETRLAMAGRRKSSPSTPAAAAAAAPDTRTLAAAAPAKTGRNDPCPCGSGRKFKKCCGAAN